MGGAGKNPARVCLGGPFARATVGAAARDGQMVEVSLEASLGEDLLTKTLWQLAVQVLFGTAALTDQVVVWPPQLDPFVRGTTSCIEFSDEPQFF